MSNSLGSMDFFALEAGEYLERLGTIVAQEGGPKPDEFVRFARALRGSALMANQSEFAAAAGGLEAVARSLRDGRLQWDAAARETAGQGVEELKALLRQANTWSDAESQSAGRLARQLEQVAGQPGPATNRRAADAQVGELNTGVRAFVAREGALIASALERAGRAMAADPTNAEPVNNVVRRMQSLRGLAELTDLSPLPEMLDGLEIAAASFNRLHAYPPDVADVFRHGAEAMTRASRDVAHHGRPDPAADEARRFSKLLTAAFALEDDVVSIDQLAPEGGQSVVTPGNPQPSPGRIVAVEMVSQGEHVTRMADTLLAAGSVVQRELRLFAVIDTLRSLDARLGRQFDSAFQIFGEAARQALKSAGESGGLDLLGSSLRQLGDILTAVTDADDHQQTVRRISELADQATTITTATAADDSPVVPIEDLAPTPSPPAAPPAAPASETSPAGGLAASFSTYHDLVTAGADQTPSIEALGRTEPVAAEETVVDISTLLYQGPAARERAHTLGREISDCLERPGVFLGLRPLLEELLDLLPLADGPAAH